MSFPQEATSRLLQKSPENYCRNGCGFHGNPEWGGYCSKCSREILQNGSISLTESVKSIGTKESDSGGRSRAESAAAAERPSSLQFSKFELKKKAQATTKKGKVSQFFKRKPVDLADSPSGTSSPNVAADLNDFLKTLKKPAAQDIISQLKKFTQDVMHHSPRPVADNQQAVQKFYFEMFKRFQISSPFKGMTEDQLDTAMDSIEKYIMTRLHGLLFSPSDTDDEQKDQSLVQRMKQYRWLKIAHLGVDVNLDSVPRDMKQVMDDAMKELLSIDSKRSPQEKLESIVNCSKHIFVLLHSCNSGPAGADHFLPTLIYVIIQAMPPHLHSNMEYIQRFSNPARLSSGESSYYYTNLCGAVTFIENISADTLHMAQDEFDGCLASNDLLESPEGSISEPSHTDCDPLTVLKMELEKCGMDLPTDEELQPTEDDLPAYDVEQFEPLRIMRVHYNIVPTQANEDFLSSSGKYPIYD
jgi:hypothetical protein